MFKARYYIYGAPTELLAAHHARLHISNGARSYFMTCKFKCWLVGGTLCCACLVVSAADTWQEALDRMPLGPNVTELTEKNCVRIMLPALQSNDVVKALIFMPGATDEFYMFHRARAKLTNDAPTLLDAVQALTNQTYIRVTFRPPLLLLHTDEDPLEPLVMVRDFATASRLEAKPFVSHALYNDRDWDYLLPILGRKLGVWFSPAKYSRDSWHFYRHSFAAWNLNGWEGLEAVALAGKSRFTIGRKHVIFEGDTREMAPPRTDHINLYRE
jgi:hypothetical protein